MKTFIFLLCPVLLFNAPVWSQQTFELKDLSKHFDIRFSVEDCASNGCFGKARFSFFTKGTAKPYQVIEQDRTCVDPDPASKTSNYNTQNTILIRDFNFDGMEDVAICNGNQGNYGARSYDVYVSSRSAGKFVNNPFISELGQTGTIGVDAKNKTLSIGAKDGCCLHVTEEYKVVNNRPVKVKIITRRLVNDKWQTSVRHVEREK